MHLSRGRSGSVAALGLVLLAVAGCSDDSDGNRSPAANAGADRSAPVGFAVTLDGSASSDPDGTALTWAWTFASRPDGSTAPLSGAATVSPTFTPDVLGAYVLELVVSDGSRTASDRVTLTATNTDPTASAGADVSAPAGQAVPLEGAVADADGHTVTHAWSLVAPEGSAATLAADAPLSTSLQTDVEGVYVVRLTAQDGWSTSFDEVVVTATYPYAGGEIAATPDATPNAELTAIAARLDAVLAIGKNTLTTEALATRLMNPPPGRWLATSAYALNAFVTYAGATYKSLQASNANHLPDEASSAWWVAAAPPVPAAIAVVDVRDAADFAKGHIPGAINVPLAQLPSTLLANPAALPATELAVASYNGNDGNMATLLVNAARYNGTSIPGFALGLMGGMTTWSYDLELSPTRFDDDAGARRIENGATVTSASAPTGPTYGYPSIGAFAPAVDDVAKKILVRAASYLATLEQEAAAAGVPHREAFWTTFVAYGALVGTAQEPQVLSVRSAADYNTKGHVPGAVNVPWQQVAKLATQTKLADPGRKVFVYCYTGHTGAQATMALGIMGYQARNVLYGLNGWTSNVAVLGTSLQKFDAIRAYDFPQHDWTDAPGSLVGWVPPRAGCGACHRSHVAQFWELAVFPPAGAPAPVASEGEG
jgi:rhodanese-related sulfurtransferase